MDIQKLKISWLGQCPICERSEHHVETIKGTKDHLYEDDRVKCWCGQTGLIETDNMGSAWCEWDVKEITEHDKFNAYYRKKYPEYWALLPSCNYQACTHHGELFNSWLNAKAQTVPEGFVLVPKSEIGHYYYDESEGMYIDEPDHFLTDLDIGEAQEVKCRDYFDLPSKYAAKVWDEDNQDVGTWEFFNTETEANNVAAHCKAMIEAQEQSHD